MMRQAYGIQDGPWHLTYEDDMSVAEGADQEDKMHGGAGPVVNNNTNAINDEITQLVGL